MDEQKRTMSWVSVVVLAFFPGWKAAEGRLRLFAAENLLVMVLAFCLANVFGGSTAGAQVEPVELPGPFATELRTDESLHGFETLFPELEMKPAPNWLKTGKRWTYFFAQDNAGEQYWLFDLVALTGTNSVVAAKQYLNVDDLYYKSYTPISSILKPGYGDFWISPSVLVDAEKVADPPELTVVRMYHKNPPYPGVPPSKTYKVVRFTYTHGADQTVYSFEESTGRLIYHRLTTSSGNRLMFFVDERVLPLPWVGSKTRAWVKTSNRWTLLYRGQWVRASDGDLIRFPFKVTAQRTDYASSWGEYKLNQYADFGAGWDLLSSITSCTGLAQLFDALWIPAEAAAAAQAWPLNKKVQIYSDVFTKSTLVGLRQSNNNILLTETGKNGMFRSEMTYRPSDGRLIKIKRVDKDTFGTGTTTISVDFIK
jgi:hypothetical protein